MDSKSRKIAHIDMDCFYAAVEVRDNPLLHGQAVAIGGHRGHRGVLSTCNYEARKFGLHSAMPTAQAVQLCPQLVLVSPNMDKYRRESKHIFAILQRYTDKIQTIALDEAFLDLTHNDLHQNSATLTTQEIQQVILRERKLSASAGVAPNKFLAKVASDWRKPAGFFAINPSQVQEFVKALPVTKIPGVGKVLAQKLQRLNLHTCQDLQNFGRFPLIKEFGNMGQKLYDLAHGRDDSPVENERIAKSISVEETFEHDVWGTEQCLPHLEKLYEKLMGRWRQSSEYVWAKDLGGYTLFVKIKYSNFQQTTIEKKMHGIKLEHFVELFIERYGANPKAIRLLGMGIRLPEKHEHLQLNFL